MCPTKPYEGHDKENNATISEEKKIKALNLKKIPSQKRHTQSYYAVYNFPETPPNNYQEHSESLTALGEQLQSACKNKSR
jgi:hypothetical protein